MKFWICMLVASAGIVISSSARANTFNGAADNQIDSHGYYYAVGGGLFPNGQTRNGDNASGGTMRFITDDPNWGYTIDSWQKDDWYPSTSSLALTLSNNNSVVFDNNGIETGNVPANYWNGTVPPSDPTYGSQTEAYEMSNNYDWIYAGYFHLSQATVVNQITGYFVVQHNPADPNAFQFDPNDPDIRFHANNFSEVGGELPANTGSFQGDVFTSDHTPGTFSWSDTGYDRTGGSGIASDIYRLNFTLDTPITLAAGDYYFSHDATIVPLPKAAYAGLGLIAGLGLLGGLKRRQRKLA
jgi:hypothetical protein